MGKYRFFADASWRFKDIEASSIEEALKLAEKEERTQWQPTLPEYEGALMSATDLGEFPHHDMEAGGEYRFTKDKEGRLIVQKENPSAGWRDKWRDRGPSPKITKLHNK